jgi:hypothetical protein
LKPATPQEGFELAIKLSRMSIKYMQPDEAVRKRLRTAYAENAEPDGNQATQALGPFSRRT